MRKFTFLTAMAVASLVTSAAFADLQWSGSLTNPTGYVQGGRVEVKLDYQQGVSGIVTSSIDTSGTKVITTVYNAAGQQVAQDTMRSYFVGTFGTAGFTFSYNGNGTASYNISLAAKPGISSGWGISNYILGDTQKGDSGTRSINWASGISAINYVGLLGGNGNATFSAGATIGGESIGNAIAPNGNLYARKNIAGTAVTFTGNANFGSELSGTLFKTVANGTWQDITMVFGQFVADSTQVNELKRLKALATTAAGDYKTAVTEFANAKGALTTAQGTYDTAKSNFSAAKSEYETANAAIVALAAEIDSFNAAWAAYEATEFASYDEAFAAYETLAAQYETASAAYAAAEAAKAAASNKLIAAAGAYSAADTAYKAAKTAYDTASSKYSTASGNYTTANNAYNAYANYGNARNTAGIDNSYALTYSKDVASLANADLTAVGALAEAGLSDLNDYAELVELGATPEAPEAETPEPATLLILGLGLAGLGLARRRR